MDAPTPGQLLLYAIRIEQDGAINNLNEFVTFPDYPTATKVSVLKNAIPALP